MISEVALFAPSPCFMISPLPRTIHGGHHWELEASKLLPAEVEHWRLSWSVRIAGIQFSWVGLGDPAQPFPSLPL